MTTTFKARLLPRIVIGVCWASLIAIVACTFLLAPTDMWPITLFIAGMSVCLGLYMTFISRRVISGRIELDEKTFKYATWGKTTEFRIDDITRCEKRVVIQHAHGGSAREWVTTVTCSRTGKTIVLKSEFAERVHDELVKRLNAPCRQHADA